MVGGIIMDLLWFTLRKRKIPIKMIAAIIAGTAVTITLVSGKSGY